jgi:hypothetical protein
VTLNIVKPKTGAKKLIAGLALLLMVVFVTMFTVSHHNQTAAAVTPAITSITPDRGSIDGGTEVTILGSDFGSQSPSATVAAIFNNGDYYVTDGSSITVYRFDGSEVETDVSALKGGITNMRALRSGSSSYSGGLVTVLDDSGNLYFVSLGGLALVAVDFIDDMPSSGIAIYSGEFCRILPYDYDDYGDEYYSVSCSFKFVDGDGMLGQATFYYEHSPPEDGDNEIGGEYTDLEIELPCEVDAMADSYHEDLWHCTDGSIYYQEDWTDASAIGDTFEQFVGYSYVLTTDGKLYYYKYSLEDWAEVNTDQFVGEVVYAFPANGGDEAYVLNDQGELYRTDSDYDSASGENIESLIPEEDIDLDLTTIDGTAVQLYNQDYSYYNGQEIQHWAITDDGAVWYSGYDNYNDDTSKYGFVKSNLSILPRSTKSTVIFDADGTPAACEVSSWSETSIKCTTTAHSEGAVSVTVSNGARNAVALSGFLYQTSYISIDVGLTNDSSKVVISDDNGTTDVDGKITPTPGGTFAKGSHTLTATTNNSKGHYLTISTNSASNSLEHTSMAGVSIPATANTCSWSDASRTLANDTDNTLSNNTYGFTLSSSDLTAQKLCQIPNSNSPLTIKSTTEANDTGDDTVVYYGAKIDARQPAGEYKATIVFTAIGNP